MFPPPHPSPSVLCPRCGSPSIEPLNYGKKAGGAIGAVGGAASGVAGAWHGAVHGERVGRAIGAVVGPAGSLLGRIAGAVLGGLLGATTGGMAGAALGELIDEHLLDNDRCTACGHTFSASGSTGSLEIGAEGIRPMPDDMAYENAFSEEASLVSTREADTPSRSFFTPLFAPLLALFR